MNATLVKSIFDLHSNKLRLKQEQCLARKAVKINLHSNKLRLKRLIEFLDVIQHEFTFQ